MDTIGIAIAERSVLGGVIVVLLGLLIWILRAFVRREELRDSEREKRHIELLTVIRESTSALQDVARTNESQERTIADVQRGQAKVHERVDHTLERLHELASNLMDAIRSTCKWVTRRDGGE